VRYLGTGRRTEMQVNPRAMLFSLPLVGDFGPASGGEAESAALLLGAIITQDGENVIPYRPAQAARDLGHRRPAAHPVRLGPARRHRADLMAYVSSRSPAGHGHEQIA
jgi:hypothetical protein